MLELLASRRAAVDPADREGHSPLHSAARWGHAVTLETLLALRADAASRFGGTTALHLAATNKKAQAVEVLLRHGAEAGAVDNFGRTPRRLGEEAGLSGAVWTLEAPGRQEL